jgi:nicotinamide mononucleotide transporter
VISPLELAAVIFAIAYLVLAVQQNILCWPAALVSVALSLVLFLGARLYMESALQVFYFAMAIYGWYQWRRGGKEGEGVAVHWWSWQCHLAAIVTIIVLTAAFGWAWSLTNAALPVVDSFTTVSAVITTYMVARKVIENWIYWFVIDSVSVWLYLERDLLLYAGLFVIYLVLIVIGFRAWLADWRQGHVAAAG